MADPVLDLLLKGTGGAGGMVILYALISKFSGKNGNGNGKSELLLTEIRDEIKGLRSDTKDVHTDLKIHASQTAGWIQGHP